MRNININLDKIRTKSLLTVLVSSHKLGSYIGLVAIDLAIVSLTHRFVVFIAYKLRKPKAYEILTVKRAVKLECT